MRTKAALLGRHCVRGCYWDEAVWGQRLGEKRRASPRQRDYAHACG